MTVGCLHERGSRSHWNSSWVCQIYNRQKIGFPSLVSVVRSGEDVATGLAGAAVVATFFIALCMK